MKTICLTPMKNEEWILEAFLESTSKWADVIILLDQNSTDKSIEIANKFEKVRLIFNTDNNYDEVGRQKRLIEEARKIEGDKLLVALDCDEFLSTSNIEDLKTFEPGTTFRFQWANIISKNDEDKCWFSSPMPFAFIDDGTEHTGSKIHSIRVPQKEIIDIPTIYVLHLQYINWNRMVSKHNWYVCWERINNPVKNSIDIYRQYHHMYSLSKNKLFKVNEEWLKNIDFTKIHFDNKYYWDVEVERFVQKYGKKYFNKELYFESDLDKMALFYLRNTQGLYNLVPILFRVVDLPVKLLWGRNK